MKLFAIIAALILMSSFALAASYKQLTGSYRIGGQTYFDPPENEPQNTHLYIELTGTSAKDLYEMMAAIPQPDVCDEIGTKTKEVGGMTCTRSANGKDYRCWFGVDVKNQKITGGVMC